MWKCGVCGEQIEDQFDACWRCAGEDQVMASQGSSHSDKEESSADFECARCGSRRVVPNARFVDQGEDSDGKAKVRVHANPSAWIFKGAAHTEVMAKLCCHCGHLELWCAGDLEGMWQAYLRSRDG